jgi:phage shock protein PspC (stress-responsive transcriptional regulator)
MEDQDSPDRNEDNFFDKMDNTKPSVIINKLQRSRNNVIIAGVCAGLGDYLKIDIAVVRLTAILSLLLGGWSITVYLIAAALLPRESIGDYLSENDVLLMKKENYRTVFSGLLVLSGLYFGLELLGIRNNENIFILQSGFIFPVVSIAAGVYLFSIKENRQLIKNVNLTQNYFRSRKDRFFMGVCGGLANYIKTDSDSIRIIMVIITLLTLGFFAIIYFAFTLLTKYEPESSFEFPQ